MVEPRPNPSGTLQNSAVIPPCAWSDLARSRRKLCRKLAPLSLAALLAACGQQNTFVAPPPPKVMVAKPVKGPKVQYVEATGNTAALANVDLEARVQGFLEKISYEDGHPVKQGDLLFEIQRDTYEAQLAQAQANFESAQAAVVNADIQYQRQLTLGRQGNLANTQKQIDDAKTTLDQAKASVDSAKASVELATINLGYTRVTAPFNGIVTRHLIDIGALVGYSGPTKLATILQIKPIYVYFTVSEEVVLRVKQQIAESGQKVQDLYQLPVEIGLMTDAGYPRSGHLNYVAPQVNASTGTLDARAIFENSDGALLPGYFVRVRVPIRSTDGALWVDETAVGQNQLGEYLLVLDKDDVVEQRQVKIGQAENGLRVIDSGLAADDWVVTGGIQRAVPGQKVNPERRTMVTAAAGQ
ncbi:MAG TPA: efflux RND transporter periplasmic adaptor subunit [Roseiarcus sp.]|nr:efflux RND transporter periplasmic adaptor subunit [Roseiarcus sp.]